MSLLSKETRFQIKHFSLFFLFLLLFVFTHIVFNSHSFGADLFVSSTGSGESCYQNAPCDLQTAITNANDGDTIFVAGIAGETYYGAGDNVIEITNSINLIGGWDGSPTGDIVIDSEANPTILDGGETRRVIHISGSGETPTIDGFTIQNGNASGETENCLGNSNDPSGCGGGIFVYQADPVITNNTITSNVATDTGGYLNKGYGGGIYSVYSDAIEISNNTFTNNKASQGSQTGGIGGGIFLYFAGETSSIINNHFFENYGATNTEFSSGGAIDLGSSHTLVQNNVIENNTASNQANNSLGSGLYLWFGAANIRNNTIIGNNNGSAVYLGHFSGTFEQNRVLENSTEHALYVTNGDSASITLTNNLIGGTDTHTLNLNATLTDPISAEVKHNTLVGNGSTYGVYIANYCTVNMTNNIVSNHSTGVTVTGETSYLTQNYTLFWNNTTSGETGTNPAFGNPAFKNPTESEYSIMVSSAARDSGTDAGITTDIEGRARPKGSGYDIGAYEFYPAANAGMLFILFN